MKKIINGRKYDTETATCLGWKRRGTPGSFDYWEETLYRKKTKEFFLHGEGGAWTIYAKVYSGGETGDGEEIIPLTDAAAMEWAEKNLSVDEYEEIFGEIAE